MATNRLEEIILLVICGVTVMDAFIVWKKPQQLYSMTTEEGMDVTTELPLKVRLDMLKTETQDALERLRETLALKKTYNTRSIKQYNPTCFFSALPCTPKNGYIYVRRQRTDA